MPENWRAFIMLSKTGCCVSLYSSARNPINHALDYQVPKVRREDGAARLSVRRFWSVCSCSRLSIWDTEGISIDGLLWWCRQNPRGALNSHCYVISSEHGLVRLWVVVGLSMVISQALSVAQNQQLLCAAPVVGMPLLSQPIVPVDLFLWSIRSDHWKLW